MRISRSARLVLGATAFIVVAGLTQQAVAAEPCCFTNPRFTGVCSVTPGEGETCANILGYLNNPNSVGKSYCGGTTIRGGWAKVACDSGARAMCSGNPVTTLDGDAGESSPPAAPVAGSASIRSETRGASAP